MAHSDPKAAAIFRDLLVQEARREFEPVVIDLRQTCGACPSQWEGETNDGRAFYARYRWGHLHWGFGSSVGAAVDAAMRRPGLELGDDLDGVLGTSAMLDATGLRQGAALTDSQ